MFVFGGFLAFSRQIAIVEHCGLTAEGQLSSDFYAGACHAINSKTALLCFDFYAPKSCHT